MTSLDHLLPAVDEQVRCADFSRVAAVDPGGTAIRADRVVLVETSLPWPKPIFDHPTLKEIDPLFKAAVRPTRLLGCQLPAGAQERSSTQVWVFDRLGAQVRERRFDITSPDQLLDLGACLAAEVKGSEQSSPEAPAPVYDGTVDGPAALVCTQGSHDICCGSDGERFARAAEELGIPNLRVFRVSHTGGHRFAPTAMTLPDGRMWAYLTTEILEDVLTGRGDSAHLAQFCRGWWGAEVGPAQVAERAVWSEAGFGLDNVDRSCVEVEPNVFAVEVDGHDNAAGVDAADRRWLVDVQLTREVPTIACRKPGGLPTKIGREYQASVRSRA